MTRRSRCALVLGLLVTALAGCGGAGGDAGADPAAALPAHVVVYVEFVVRPEGAQREQMESLARKVLRTEDPGRKIVEMLESAKPGGGTYAQDVEPWLGRRVGLALRDFQGEEPTFLAAVATSDAEIAAESLARLAEREKEKRTTYKESDLYTDADGDVSAVAGDYVLLAGSEAEMRRAIDVREGASLAESARFRDAIGPLPDGRAGAVYLDFKRIVDQAAATDGLGASELGVLRSVLGGEMPPVALAVLAEDDLIAIEGRQSTKGLTGLVGALGGLGLTGATPLVGEVPGDAWLAFGAPKVGATVKTAVDSFAGAIGGAVLGGQLEQQLGIDLDRDVYGWIGDVAGFVRGRDVASLDGGVVIELADGPAARAAIPRLLGIAQQQDPSVSVEPVRIAGARIAFELAFPGAPRPVVIAVGETRAVIAYGRDAALAGLAPNEKLADGEAWDRAGDALDGLDPVAILDMPAALGIIASAAAGDPDFAQARPYLETIGVIAAGAETSGDVQRSRLSVGVK